MKLPARYTDLRDRLDVDEVSCGCGGIKLLAAHEVDEGQIGYAIDPDGTS